MDFTQKHFYVLKSEYLADKGYGVPDLGEHEGGHLPLSIRVVQHQFVLLSEEDRPRHKPFLQHTREKNRQLAEMGWAGAKLLERQPAARGILGFSLGSTHWAMKKNEEVLHTIMYSGVRIIWYMKKILKDQ